MRGDDSARWPNSSLPGGVAQEGLLIPVTGCEFGVVGGGVEQNDGHGSGTSRSGPVKHAVRVDDFEASAQMRNTSQSCLGLEPEPHARMYV